MSFLEPYFAASDDPNMNRSKSAPSSVPTQVDVEIEKIFDHRVVGKSKKNTKTEFLIHRKGKSAADAVWRKRMTFGNLMTKSMAISKQSR